MLKWMCGHILMDKIRNQEFREKLEVTLIWQRCVKIDWDDMNMPRERLFYEPVSMIDSIIVEGNQEISIL